MCCIFRNELGGEPRRHLGLIECEGSEDTHGEGQTWHRENLAAEVSVLEDVSNVYLGGRSVFGCLSLLFIHTLEVHFL